MMKLWLIIFDISSQVSNGFAIVSAPNPTTAQLTLMALGNGRLIGYNITGILEVGNSTCHLIRILTEGITSRGEAGSKGEKGEQGELGPKGDPFTYNDFTPLQLEALRGPVGPLGALGLQGPKGDRGEQGLLGILGILGELGPQGITGALGPVGPLGPAGKDGKDGIGKVSDNDFEISEDGELRLRKTNDMLKDNTLPITSGGVYTVVGNIETLLETI